MAKQKNKTVAQKIPFLYVYAFLNMLALSVNLTTLVHTQKTYNLNSGNSYRREQVIGDVLGVVLVLLVNIYLVTSTNIGRVSTIIKVLLGLQLLGVIVFLFRGSYFYDLVLSLVQIGLTYITLQKLSGNKKVTLF